MRVWVDCDRPRAGTARLVPAVVSMLHPGAGGAVVHAFVLRPQAVQSQPMASGPHQLHADGTSSRPDPQLRHTVLAHPAHQLGRGRAQLPLLRPLHPPAGSEPQPRGAAPHGDIQVSAHGPIVWGPESRARNTSTAAFICLQPSASNLKPVSNAARFFFFFFGLVTHAQQKEWAGVIRTC